MNGRCDLRDRTKHFPGPRLERDETPALCVLRHELDLRSTRRIEAYAGVTKRRRGNGCRSDYEVLDAGVTRRLQGRGRWRKQDQKGASTIKKARARPKRLG
eukprot:4535962-Pleurochrysis_carterae.AAC.1